MHIAVVLFVLAFVAHGCFAACPSTGSTSGRTIRFRDEFSGPLKIDNSKDMGSPYVAGKSWQTTFPWKGRTLSGNSEQEVWLHTNYDILLN